MYSGTRLGMGECVVMFSGVGLCPHIVETQRYGGVQSLNPIIFDL